MIDQNVVTFDADNDGDLDLVLSRMALPDFATSRTAGETLRTGRRKRGLP